MHGGDAVICPESSGTFDANTFHSKYFDYFMKILYNHHVPDACVFCVCACVMAYMTRAPAQCRASIMGRERDGRGALCVINLSVKPHNPNCCNNGRNAEDASRVCAGALWFNHVADENGDALVIDACPTGRNNTHTRTHQKTLDTRDFTAHAQFVLVCMLQSMCNRIPIWPECGGKVVSHTLSKNATLLTLFSQPDDRQARAHTLNCRFQVVVCVAYCTRTTDSVIRSIKTGVWRTD